MTLAQFNALPIDEASAQLAMCCGAAKWYQTMVKAMPFKDVNSLCKCAEHIWYDQCFEQEWLEAFSHHPAIGDLNSLRTKYLSTSHFTTGEQSGAAAASEQTLLALARANELYVKKNGFIFIVCATGKTADDMLGLINDRLNNTYFEELNVAMGEQFKITLLRLQKILHSEVFQLKLSQITTHVLDTSVGKPGKNVTIQLKRSYENGWQTLAQGITNSDGRIIDLLPSGRSLVPGHYKMVFAVKKYYDQQGIKGFYPEVDIQFILSDESHYHIPLLINPFGYTTYRGS